MVDEAPIKALHLHKGQGFMIEEQYTPPPWDIAEQYNDKGEIEIIANEGRFKKGRHLICRIPNGRKLPMYLDPFEHIYKEAHANGRLIKAAPALLDACQIALEDPAIKQSQLAHVLRKAVNEALEG